jgi:hypothetical protein
MRTTLTLDPDVAEQIRLAMKQRGKGLKTIVNEALRRGLCLERTEKAEAFQVEAHDFGIVPGIDLDRMNQLVDEIEVDHFTTVVAPAHIVRGSYPGLEMPA